MTWAHARGHVDRPRTIPRSWTGLPTNSPTTTRWSTARTGRLTFAQLRDEVRTGRRGDDRPGRGRRGPGRDLVAEHLALGGGLPGHALRRRRASSR